MKQATVKRTLLIITMVALVLAAFTAGNITGWLARPVLAADEEPAEFTVFWEAWGLVREYFVDQDKIDVTAMTYGAIQGMLNTLGDQNHTVFFPPEVARQQDSALDGSFEGIGAYVDSADGVFKIVTPIHGSPAEEAGVLAGDVVLAVNGEEIAGMAEWEVIALIRGPAGTTVTLTIQRPQAEEPVQLEIERRRIDIESVLWARIPGTNLVHLQITRFANDTSQELDTALQEILHPQDGAAPTAGIILDLRNNPGGYLQEALLVASQFLPVDAVVLHEVDAHNNMTTHRVQGSGQARDIPLIVLINPGSASAAEILAGALQDNGRAKLVGEKTVGTGTVLRPFTLSDGSVMRLGVTNWLTPNQKLIKGEGIQPDIKVEQEASVEMINSTLLETLDATAVRTHADRQFQTALFWLAVHTQPAPAQAIQ